MLIEAVAFTIVQESISPVGLTQKEHSAEVSAALANLLTWSLVVGLALAGLGQYMQALAHRWTSKGGRRFDTVGTLVGMAGWATGLFAGVLFPIASNPESEASLHIAMALGFAGPVVISLAVIVGRKIQLFRARSSGNGQ